MNKTRLAATLSLSLLTLSVAHSAQYQVVELPLGETGVASFPTAINADGKVAVNVQNPYNLPIDVSLIDFETQALIDNLTDIDAARAGDLNEEDYALLFSFISSANGSSPNQFFQQLPTNLSYLVDENTIQFIPGYDQISAETNAYSFSADTNIRGLNDAGDTVGSGEDIFTPVEYTNESGADLTYVVNGFRTRAFATVNEVTVELAPIDVTAGGVSTAYGINNSHQVAGFVSVEIASESFQTAAENCTDDELRADIPIESCLQTIMNSVSVTNFQGLFQNRGMIWQLDELGNIVDTQELGLLFTPEADDEGIYISRALAINDNGVAVGSSSDFYQDSENVSIYAAIYEGANVLPITNDDEYFSSTAIDINDNNQVVGHGFKSINGTTRSKFFIHDMNSNETTFPDDFFQGSSSVATAINNNGIVVGYGQVDFSTTVQRRNEGFIYDHVTQEFQNINALLACDSAYNITQINGINDLNELSATAVINKPARSIITGEILLDSDGSEILVATIVAVKLLPIGGGSIEDCEGFDAIPDRKGASISYFYILAFLLFGIRIRRKYK
jgi:uncharacterized membrane protein